MCITVWVGGGGTQSPRRNAAFTSRSPRTATRTPFCCIRQVSRYAVCTSGGGACNEEVVNVFLEQMHSDRVRLSDQINKYLLGDCYEGARLDPRGWVRRAVHTTSYTLRHSPGNTQTCLHVKGKEKKKTLEITKGPCESFLATLCCSQSSCEHQHWFSFLDRTSEGQGRVLSQGHTVTQRQSWVSGCLLTLGPNCLEPIVGVLWGALCSSRACPCSRSTVVMQLVDIKLLKCKLSSYTGRPYQFRVLPVYPGLRRLALYNWRETIPSSFLCSLNTLPDFLIFLFLI